MRKYKHSLNRYEKELESTKQKIKTSRDALNYFLASNTGRTSTHHSNQAIMSVVDNLITLSYNEKHYDGTVYDIIHGYALEGDTQ